VLGIRWGRQNVTGNQTINFKDPWWITAWLDTALKKEKEKYEKCPVVPDVVPGHDAAQGWGYVVTGYFLLEEAFKALLFARGKTKVSAIHSLSLLFNQLEVNDQDALREYYNDYRATTGGAIGAFPFKSLDGFLLNLDGDKNAGGNHIGSFDWRYFLIEEKRSKDMPIVGVDYLHEIAYGCIRTLEYACNRRFEPTRYTHSWRLRGQRSRKYRKWLTARMNSEGWDELGDRLEILWGPDYLGRYDLYFFRGKNARACFSNIPENLTCPVIDKRKEIESFDVEQGHRSICVTRSSWPDVK